MAGTLGPAPDHLRHLRRAAARVAGLSPLALLRGVEARAPTSPRIGAAKLPKDDLVALAQAPALAFPAATLDAVRVERGRAELVGHWFGLTGPMGPLPLHLTEYAAFERRHARQRPFGRFLDLLSGRMLQFFYRAWAEGVPAASVDRPGDDRFGDHIAQLSGARDGAASSDRFPALARLHHAALFASPRSPSMIGDALSHLLGTAVRVVEYVERRRDIAAEDRTRLGGSFAGLGQGAVIGGRVTTADEAFRVVVEAADMKAYRSLLPGGARYALLTDALAAFSPPHLEFEVAIALAGDAVEPARLGGGARLGWSSWNARGVPGEARCDARLGDNARRLARRTQGEMAA